MQMELFIETTVFVGYCFIDDGWNTASIKHLNLGLKKWTSQRVCNEFNKQFRYKSRVRNEAMLKFRDNVANSITTNPQSNNIDMKKIGRLIPIVKDDNNNTNWVKNVAMGLVNASSTKVQLVSKIEAFINVYMQFSLKHYSEIQRWCGIQDMTIECWSRFTPYETISSSFVNDGMLNEDDNEILLDAHDLCATCPGDIHFITGDWNDIASHKASIVNLTNIADVVYLGNSPF